MKIGIIGSSGFLGTNISKFSRNFKFEIIDITKENYTFYKKEKFDILINTAMPSAKFWALNNPFDDFQKTVGLTADIVYNWNYEKLIQISTISAEEYVNRHPYAINKKTAEILSSYKNHLIIRVGTLYGDGLKKGALYDLLNSKRLYVDIKSEYDYIDTEFVSTWIFNNLDRTGIVELGACDTISLSEIATTLDITVNSSGRCEKIFSPRIEPNMPSARNVLNFARKYLELISN